MEPYDNDSLAEEINAQYQREAEALERTYAEEHLRSLPRHYLADLNREWEV